MSIRRAFLASLFGVLLVSFASSQVVEKPISPSEAGPIRSSAAYAEIVMRRIELQADLESFIPDYTDTNPKILDLRFELGALDKALEKVYAIKPSETGKLTLALGKMMVKRAMLETDLARLLRTYTNEQKEVKRAKRRVEIYDAAIRDILP
jgi:hypothetical protein